MLQFLPDTALIHILKYLTHTDKKSCRLVSRWLADKIFHAVKSLRTWTIHITEQNYQDVKLALENILKKQKLGFSKLFIHINYCNKYVTDNLTYRHHLLKWILEKFNLYISTLRLKLLGDERFLLDPQIICPNLEILSLSAYNRSGIHGNIGIIDYGASTLIKQTLVENHSLTLKTLEINDFANLNITKSLVLKTLIVNGIDEYTLKNILTRSKDSLTALEVRRCLDLDNISIYLPNLRHLIIDFCLVGLLPSYDSFVRAHSRDLVTLFLDSEMVDTQFPNLKYLDTTSCLVEPGNRVGVPVVPDCTGTLDYLVAVSYYENEESQPPLIPESLSHLKDIYLSYSTQSFADLLMKNSSTLEFLYINEISPRGASISNLMCEFPRLKQVLLPCCDNFSVIKMFEKRCPKDVQIITDENEVERLVIKRAVKRYPYPRIHPLVRAFGIIL